MGIPISNLGKALSASDQTGSQPMDAEAAKQWIADQRAKVAQLPDSGRKNHLMNVLDYFEKNGVTPEDANNFNEELCGVSTGFDPDGEYTLNDRADIPKARGI